MVLGVISLLVDENVTPNEELYHLVGKTAAEILSQRLKDHENFGGEEPSTKRPRIDSKERDLPFLVAQEVNKHLLLQTEKNLSDLKNPDLETLKEIYHQRCRPIRKLDLEETEFAPKFRGGENCVASLSSSCGTGVRSLPFEVYDDPTISRQSSVPSTQSALSEVSLRPWSLRYWGEFCDGRFRERKKRDQSDDSNFLLPSNGPNADPIRLRADRLHQLFPESNEEEIYVRLRQVAAANLDAEFDRMTESLRKTREEQSESPLLQVIMEPISPTDQQQLTTECEKDEIFCRTDDFPENRRRIFEQMQEIIQLPDDQDGMKTLL